jgi:hypothetical protein
MKPRCCSCPIAIGNRLQFQVIKWNAGNSTTKIMENVFAQQNKADNCMIDTI